MKKIFIQGYATSGMTALRDFMLEFEGNYLLNDEFDLLRHVDGILSLENNLTVNNCFWHDAAIKRFRHFVDYLNRPSSRGVLGRNWQERIGPDFLKVSNEFISALVRNEKEGRIQYYNPHTVDDFKQLIFSYYNYSKKFAFLRLILSLLGKDKLMPKSVVFTKRLNQEEFISLASEYIGNLFMLVKNCEALTLMHPLMISGNIEHQFRYLGNAKVVISNRDPRDVYVDVATKKVGYIPWENLDDFVFWFKELHANCPIVNVNVLNINFEDLVINYDETSSKIIIFLELDKFKRNPKCIFNPDISRKNVGLYHTYYDQNSILFIEKELSEFCYDIKIN